MISESVEKQEKALNNDKQIKIKIFLAKIKRRGSNLKKRSEFYKDYIQTCIQPLISICDKFKELTEVFYSKVI